MTKMTKTKKSKKIIFSIGILGLLIILLFISNLYVLLNTPQTYMTTADNYFSYQFGNACSGYSAAYVLRSMGEEAHGVTLYLDIPYKNADGTVMPTVLVKYLKERGYDAKLCMGTITQMKHDLSKGVPIIAFVRTAPNENYYHFLPIVGYDEENIYAADSLKSYVNAHDQQYYNRVLTESDFKAMLKAGFRQNVYIVLEQK